MKYNRNKNTTTTSKMLRKELRIKVVNNIRKTSL